MFRSEVLPGGFEPVLHLERGVVNDQAKVCTEGKEPEAISHFMLAYLPCSLEFNPRTQSAG